jgi:hypothetical protein
LEHVLIRLTWKNIAGFCNRDRKVQYAAHRFSR